MQLKVTNQDVKSIVHAVNVKRFNDESEKQYLIFDFGKKLNGHLVLRLKSNSVDIAESEIKYSFGPREDFTIVKSVLKVTYEQDCFVCKDEALTSMQYARLEVPPHWGKENENWLLIGAELELKMRPVEKVGMFECSDELINNIWQAGINTVHLCMFPHKYTHFHKPQLNDDRKKFIAQWNGYESDYVLVDGPRRDREVWIGDLLPEVRTCWFSFREAEIIKNSLKVFTDQQLDDGFLPASSVSFQEFSEYCCWFVLILCEYTLFSGDYEFLTEIWSKYRKVMKWIENKVGEEGMLELGIRQTWAWTLARKGYVTSTQCVLCDAYRCASQLEKWMGYEEESRKFKNTADILKGKIREKAWNPEIKAYKDAAGCDGKSSVSLDANAYSIIFGIAQDDQVGSILDYLKDNMWSEFGTRLLHPPEEDNGYNWPHNLHIWPFAVNFEVEARLKAGKIDTAIDLIRRCWGTMVKNGSNTFWEIIDSNTGKFMDKRIHDPGIELDTWNSYCHGWSAGVSHLLQAYISGIRPQDLGFGTFIIDPQPAGLDWINARIPAPEGVIDITMKKDEDGVNYSGRILVPEFTCGRWNKACGSYTVDVFGYTPDHDEQYVLLPGEYKFQLRGVV